MTTPFISTFSVENAHSSDIYAVSACPKFTVVASGDGVLSLWDNQSPNETLVALNQKPVTSGIHHLAVDISGSVLVAVAFDGSLIAYDLKSQSLLSLKNCEKQIKGAWACAISGTSAAISTLHGTIYVIDVLNDELVNVLEEPIGAADIKRQACLCVDISRDSKYVVGGYESGKIRIYDTVTGHINYTVSSHILRPRCVKFNQQGTVIAITGDESIALYTMHGGTYLGSLLGHESFVYSVAFNDTGEQILSVAGDGRVKIWSVELKEAIFTTTASEAPLFTGCWVPGRTNIISGAPAGFVIAGVDRAIRWYREAGGRTDDI